MATWKFALLALLYRIAWTSSTQESCTASMDDEEKPMSGRAMLQVSESSLAPVHSHAPQNKSKGKSTGDAPQNKSKGNSTLDAPQNKTKGKSTSDAPDKNKGKGTSLSKGKGKVPVNASSKIKGNKTKSKSKSGDPDASTVSLNQAGYKAISGLCCNYEMEEFIRRIVSTEKLKVCDEGGLQGVAPFHTCENAQNYSLLLKEVLQGTSGLCPWTGSETGACKKGSGSCGGPTDPMSHRRRNCGRNVADVSMVMQNAATNEFTESVCGTHQQYSDIGLAQTEILQDCTLTGDIRKNVSAIKKCLNQCCTTKECQGISATATGTVLAKSFENAVTSDGSIAYLHRQR